LGKFSISSLKDPFIFAYPPEKEKSIFVTLNYFIDIGIYFDINYF
jgi:hypothetical protein